MYGCMWFLLGWSRMPRHALVVIPVRPARSTRPATREEDERPGVEELSAVESG